MFRYEITFNGDPMTCYFTDHFEAADFLDECDQFGDDVVVHGYVEVTAEDIKADDSLSHAEMIEYLSMILLPNHQMFPKWEQLEEEMQRLGLIA